VVTLYGSIDLSGDYLQCLSVFDQGTNRNCEQYFQFRHSFRASPAAYGLGGLGGRGPHWNLRSISVGSTERASFGTAGKFLGLKGHGARSRPASRHAVHEATAAMDPFLANLGRITNSIMGQYRPRTNRASSIGVEHDDLV